MKKLLLSLVAVAGIAFGTQAQTEKGKFIVGGTVGLNSTKEDGADKADFRFEVSPSVGYFVSDNFAVGTGVGYAYDKAVSQGSLTKGFQVAPFGRYYVGLSDQFKFFGQLAVPMVFGNMKDVDEVTGDVGNKTGSVTQIGVKLSPGFAFFPTKRVGIEVSVDGLGYNNLSVKDELTGIKTKTNSFGLDASTITPKLGVMFHF
ncbi:outer membrane beta-barrel protein [Pedobacter africanus]|uniref:Outer membrane protein beta-barrel domain-containing protein n=1 Tax=Pedobacter africanus TaxID=151894 RepID=A0A1W2DZ79_9SPHI|nr:outer membrane beta-barrel protein [Pedobacter africanus]SMD02773.1 Outer membrane protein beta-barrel domain-containing protein [Pedobacter africanus]